MSKYQKIVFIIAVIGELACLTSFVIAIVRGKPIAGIIFGFAGLFCLTNAVGIFKYKQ